MKPHNILPWEYLIRTNTILWMIMMLMGKCIPSDIPFAYSIFTEVNILSIPYWIIVIAVSLSIDNIIDPCMVIGTNNKGPALCFLPVLVYDNASINDILYPISITRNTVCIFSCHMISLYNGSIRAAIDELGLTHWGRYKMTSISQKTFSNAFSWVKMYELRLIFHRSSFP